MALVHGFGEHSGRYAPMAQALGAENIAVISIDLRGHGRSAGKRGVTRDYADFLADIKVLEQKCREAYPNLPIILYGHSMGGGLILNYGFNHAGKFIGFIASAPLIKLAEPPPAIVTPIVKFLRLIHPKGAIKQPINGAKVSNLPEEQALYMQDPLNHGCCGFATALGMVANGQSLQARAAQWSAPLLLLHSRDDVLTDFLASEDFAAKAQYCQFHSFNDSAHEMHNDKIRDQVYDLMLAFIQQRLAAM